MDGRRLVRRGLDATGLARFVLTWLRLDGNDKPSAERYQWLVLASLVSLLAALWVGAADRGNRLSRMPRAGLALLI